MELVELVCFAWLVFIVVIVFAFNIFRSSMFRCTVSFPSCFYCKCVFFCRCAKFRAPLDPPPTGEDAGGQFLLYTVYHIKFVCLNNRGAYFTLCDD